MTSERVSAMMRTLDSMEQEVRTRQRAERSILYIVGQDIELDTISRAKAAYVQGTIADTITRARAAYVQGTIEIGEYEQRVQAILEREA